MQKNVSGQKILLFTFDYSTNAPKTGDAANLTAYVSKDGGAVTVLTDTTATEMDATNAKGWYSFDVTQTESNADELVFTGKSSTANVSVVGRALTTTPASFTSFVTPTGASVNATQLGGATVTATTSVTFPASSTVATTTGAVGSVTGAVGSVTGNVGGNVVGSVASVTAGVTVTTNNDKTGYALSSAGIQAIWDALTSALTTVGSIGKLFVDNLNATVSSRLASASITLSGGAVTVGTNNDKTGYSVATGGIISGAFAAAEINALADGLLDRNMATGTDSGTNSTTTRTVRQALRRLRNKESIAAGTLTVTKEDDTTLSWNATVTTTAGDPLSAVDPA